MWQNEILDEIHHRREEHAKSFNYDLDGMFDDWRRKQAKGGRRVVSLSPKRPTDRPSDPNRSDDKALRI
ncbi:hypothetical protein HC928_19435 [bacterium]|nr:hypothetical protein [bacterium]